MREILFRGKRVDNGEWVCGFYANCAHPRGPESNTSHYIITYPGAPKNYHEIYTSTIGQYTGQTDKAGTKAFEHDCILQLHGDAIGVIHYGENNNAFDGYELPCHVGFYVDWVSGEDKDILRKDLGYWLSRVEVIGNIHDNPELLKGSEYNGSDN